MKPTTQGESSWQRGWRSVSFGGVALSTLLVTAGWTPVAVASTVGRAGTGKEAVIVRAVPGEIAAAQHAVTAVGGKIGLSLGIINGFAAVVPAPSVRELATSPSIIDVSPNAAVTMDSVNPTLGYDPVNDDGSLHAIGQLIGAPQAWAEGATGAGVDVALIDTGVSPVSGLDETGKVVNGPDLSVDAQVPGQASLDAYGHGTHMASIIAGRDDTATTVSQFNNPSTFVGIAPNAGIVNVRVGSDSGAVDVSQVIAGIGWVVQNAKKNGLNIKVLNLSFGTTSVQPYTIDPLDYAAEVAWRAGIVVVASAGNDGSAATALEDPANDPFVVAVGAEDGDNGTVVDGLTGVHGASVATFTNAGDPDRTVDVIAPGVHVLGLDDPGSYIDTTYPSARVGTRFFRGSGTSQAAAVVSGAFALLAQKFPTATPDELKYLLTSTAAPLDGVPTSAQGHGLIQVGKAAGLSLGLVQVLLGSVLSTLKITPAQNGTSLLNSPNQPWVPSTGTGSLNASRGGSYLLDANGVELTGEEDVWGGAVNTTALAAQESSGTAWSNGAWNGEQLIGPNAVATLWDGSASNAADFSNMRWSNMRWSGSGWSNMRWSDDGWDNMRWSGDGWD